MADLDRLRQDLAALLQRAGLDSSDAERAADTLVQITSDTDELSDSVGGHLRAIAVGETTEALPADLSTSLDQLQRRLEEEEEDEDEGRS